MKAVRISLGVILFIFAVFFLNFLFHVFKLLMVKNKKINYYFISLFSKLILAASGIKIVVESLENLKDEVYIFAANHSSYVDNLIVFTTVPRYFRIVTLNIVFNVPILGFALKQAGALPIERTFIKEKVEENLNEMVAVLKEASILIFPEGRISTDGKLQEFRRGTAEIAFRSKVPVVPVAISGSFSLLKPLPYKVMGKGIWIFSFLLFWFGYNILHFNPGEVKVIFGRPLQFSPEETVEDFTKRLEECVKSLLGER